MVGYHHHHRHDNQFIRLDIVDDDSMLLMMVVLFYSRVCNFCSRFILDGIELESLGIAGRLWLSGISGVE